MRRIIVLVTVAVVMAAMGAFSVSAAAEEPPGRAAFSGGLGTAVEKTSFGESQGGFSKVIVEYERSQDPLTPGVTPGGGGVEP